MSTEKIPTGAGQGSNMRKVAQSPPLKAGEGVVVQIATLNQGAPNEHLIVVQQFSKPGTYSYTTNLDNLTVSPVKPADTESLNRGITLAAQMIANVPVIIPRAQAVRMVPKPQEEKQNI